MNPDDEQNLTEIDLDQKMAREGLLRIKNELGLKDVSASAPASDEEKSPEDEAIELAERTVKTEIANKKQSVEQREKEAKDRRSQLLNAVRVSAPEINKPLVETFERLSLEKQQFAQRELVRLFKNDAQLQNTTDFFDLNLAQREDLLDRIGFYKGLVIDHSLSNPVESGFREVLKRPDNKNNPVTSGGSKFATLLYRKPNFSGYFENYYTSSESLHQVQKNGVTNIKTSLNVVAGKVATVGVGISGAYHNAEGENGGVKGQTVYTTANFFLPKVELSFDESEPCASDEFENACEKALAQDGLKDCFTALVAVLGSFGHFVATQTLVGGRLFATEKKQLEGNESDSSMTRSFAGKIKVGMEGWSASGEFAASAEHGNQTDTRANKVDEEQTYTIHAVGGEGAVVEQAGRWAESLYDYQRWAAVQREKLIPSIHVLSRNLRLRVWNTLKNYASSNTSSHLTEECNAYFLFYGGYEEEVGRLARPDFVVIKNLASQHCLSIAGETPQNPGVAAKLFNWTRQNLWRVTPEGHLVSAITVKSGFPGRKKPVEFALSVLKPESAAKKEPETVKDKTALPVAVSEPESETLLLGLSELSSNIEQRWEFTGRGEIQNAAYGDKYVLALPLNGKPELKLRKSAQANTCLWSIEETSPDDLKSMEGREHYGKLIHRSGLVLSVEGFEDANTTFDRFGKHRVLLQPDIGGRHQLWNRAPDGTITSAIRIGSSNPSLSSDVFLSINEKKHIFVQGKSISAEKVKCDTENRLYAGDASDNTFYLGSSVNTGMAGQSVELTSDTAQFIHYEQLSSGIVPESFCISTPQGKFQPCEKLKTVDKRELIVDGYLTGIEFIVEKRGKNRGSAWEYSRLKMKITVQRETQAIPVVWDDELDNDNIDRDFLHDYGDVVVDDRFLILPEEPIYSLRLSVNNSPKKHLIFEYQLVKDGNWNGLSGISESAKLLNVDEVKIPSGDDAGATLHTKIRGLALDYDASTQVLRPKVLRRIT